MDIVVQENTIASTLRHIKSETPEY